MTATDLASEIGQFFVLWLFIASFCLFFLAIIPRRIKRTVRVAVARILRRFW